MKLQEYSVTELNSYEMVTVEGGSWVGRRLREIGAFFERLGNEILDSIAGATIEGPGVSVPVFPQNQ